MDPFQSMYDTNHDGKLSGFEYGRYCDDNYAYPGSLCPDEYTQQSEARRIEEMQGLKTIKAGKVATPDNDPDMRDLYRAKKFWFPRDEERAAAGDAATLSKGAVRFYYEDFDKTHWYDNFWFTPKNEYDIRNSNDMPLNIKGFRRQAHRCYNCKHWDTECSTLCARREACELYEDGDRHSLSASHGMPDWDGMVCSQFAFRDEVK